MAGARRTTYLHLSQLAKDAGLQYQRRLEESREPAASGQGPAPTLARFDITMVLEGDYEGVRQFLRDVEASDGFIVIDNIGLAEGTDRNSTARADGRTVDVLPGGEKWKLTGASS